MKLWLAGLLLSVFAGTGLAQAQTRNACFENAGLKDRIRISYTINGTRVTGEWIAERDYDATQAEKFAFTGTLAGATTKPTVTAITSPIIQPALRVESLLTT